MWLIDKKKIIATAIISMNTIFLPTAYGDVIKLAGNVQSVQPDAHAPIGVMGDHMHRQGEWMLSYRYGRMKMEDNLKGSSSLNPEEIVTRIANTNPGPPLLRVVPTEMTTDMHMVGIMYAPSDQLTLMGMVSYLKKEMDHVTFMGMNGSNRLGTFTTETRGLGDTKVSMLWRGFESETHQLHWNLGISLPTGDIEEKDTVLAPTGMQAVLRLPYAMQLGSGSYDLEPGVTYKGFSNRWGWGAQYKATLRLDDNDEGYRFGDKHVLTSWGGYRFADHWSGSVRLTYQHEGEIDGRDTQIAAPVQTADPDNYGGERVDLGFGVNWVGQSGALRHQRLAFEYTVPLHQHVNGVQMEMKSMMTLGYQYSF